MPDKIPDSVSSTIVRPDYGNLMERFEELGRRHGAYVADPTPESYLEVLEAAASLALRGLVQMKDYERATSLELDRQKVNIQKLYGRVSELRKQKEAAQAELERAKEERAILEAGVEQRISLSAGEVRAKLEKEYSEKEELLHIELSAAQERAGHLEAELGEMGNLRKEADGLWKKVFDVNRKEEELKAREAALAVKAGKMEIFEGLLSELGGEGVSRLSQDLQMAVEEMRKTSKAYEKKSGKIATGDRVLDDALYGGFKAGSTVMIVGDVYSGRDRLARTLSARAISMGMPLRYVTTNMNEEAIIKEFNALLDRKPDREIPDIYDAYTMEQRGKSPNVHTHLVKWLGTHEDDSPRVVIETHKYPLVDEEKEIGADHQESLSRVRDMVAEAEGLLVLVVSDGSPNLDSLKEFADYEVRISFKDGKGEIGLSSRFPVDVKGLQFAKEENALSIRPRGDRIAGRR